MRLLLIEDDSMLGRALLVGLRQDGHATDWVQTAADAHSAWLAPQPSIVPYEAIVLDLGLPDRSGLDLLRTARARGTRAEKPERLRQPSKNSAFSSPISSRAGLMMA